MSRPTAEVVFDQVKSMPVSERNKLFSLIASRAFEEERDRYTHEEVFGELKGAAFTSNEAALYLGISMSTFRRLVKTKVIQAIDTVGRSQIFALDDLRSYKKTKKPTQH